MCGIICIAGKRNVVPLLVEGLQRLAYRGYDSAGIATLSEGKISRCRSMGKIENLEERLVELPLSGTIGIAHTRWATHGEPNEINAHPHASDKVAVVHNGIIENYQELSKELSAKGYKFKSQTDSEVIVHILTDYLNNGISQTEAVLKLSSKLKGAFALGILFSGKGEQIIGIRKGSPLAVGYGKNEMYLGSDAVGLAPLTNKITYLEDGDSVIIKDNEIVINDLNGSKVERSVSTTSITAQSSEKGNFKHFMHKEIHEQPVVIEKTLKSFLDTNSQMLVVNDEIREFESIDKITMVACGTSSFACRIAREWFEKYAHIPVSVDIASEYRYRNLFPSKDELVIFISQSGETRDTISCIEHSKNHGLKTLSIVNVIDSTISRISDKTIPTLAGPEIGVASTKAFTTQLVTLACLALQLAFIRNKIKSKEAIKITKAFFELPSNMKVVLKNENLIRKLASNIYDSKDVLYIGRGTSHGIALEGALKLKEISYIHAEGYAAGELKHGPIALIDELIPVIVIIPSNDLFEKTASNLSEAYSRGAKIVSITDKEGAEKIKDMSKNIIICPSTHSMCQPALFALPVQLLAYHIAVFKGTDIDQPRNLAKSVTVE